MARSPLSDPDGRQVRAGYSLVHPLGARNTLRSQRLLASRLGMMVLRANG